MPVPLRLALLFAGCSCWSLLAGRPFPRTRPRIASWPYGPYCHRSPCVSASFGVALPVPPCVAAVLPAVPLRRAMLGVSLPAVLSLVSLRARAAWSIGCVAAWAFRLRTRVPVLRVPRVPLPCARALFVVCVLRATVACRFCRACRLRRVRRAAFVCELACASRSVSVRLSRRA